jgi:hypothetical protein
MEHPMADDWRALWRIIFEDSRDLARAREWLEAALSLGLTDCGDLKIGWELRSQETFRVIDNESLKPVLEKSIWEYYRTWVFNARDFYSEEERIRMEIEHLIKDQNSIKDI